MRRAPAPTCTHDDLRACAPPVSGPVEEVSFLKVEKAGRLRADRRVREVMQYECEASSEYQIVGRSRCMGADNAVSVGTGPVGEDGSV